MLVEKCWTTPAVVIWPMDPASGAFAPASVKYRFPSVPTMIPPDVSPKELAGRLDRELGGDPAGCDPGDMLVVDPR